MNFLDSSEGSSKGPRLVSNPFARPTPVVCSYRGFVGGEEHGHSRT